MISSVVGFQKDALIGFLEKKICHHVGGKSMKATVEYLQGLFGVYSIADTFSYTYELSTFKK